jgi:hypothetical protein
MSNLLGDDDIGRKAYKTACKQTWEKLRTMREVIAEASMSHHNKKKKKKKKPKKGY